MVEKTRVAIASSCVCRDIFNFTLPDAYDIKKFIQLNPISLMNEHKSFDGEINADFAHLKFQSQFIRNCAEHAIKGDTVESLLKAKADILVIDLAEERIPKLLISYKGRELKITKHAFFSPLTDYFKKDFPHREIRFNALPWEDVKKSYQYFVQQITNPITGFQQENIIIVEVYMATDYIGKDYSLYQYNVNNSDFSDGYIKDVNVYLKSCYDYLESLLPQSKVIKIPENVLTSYFNRWGLNPLHYTSEVYEYLAHCVNILTGKSNRDSIESLYEELKLKNYLMRQVLQK